MFIILFDRAFCEQCYEDFRKKHEERASNREGTITRERAVGIESTSRLERAQLKERTNESERAKVSESTVCRERATVEESTNTMSESIVRFDLEAMFPRTLLSVGRGPGSLIRFFDVDGRVIAEIPNDPGKHWAEVIGEYIRDFQAKPLPKSVP